MCQLTSIRPISYRYITELFSLEPVQMKYN